jgi:hypothetical protein
MKKFLGAAAVILFGTALAYGADKTWTGKISDSMCGASHKSAIEHAGKKLTDRECVQACIKEGGKYVFVSKDKVYTIDNQDFADLAEHAGHTVHLTGEMTGDAIKVSKIEMPAKPTAKKKAA